MFRKNSSQVFDFNKSGMLPVIRMHTMWSIESFNEELQIGSLELKGPI